MQGAKRRSKSTMIGELICVTCGEILSEKVEKYIEEVKKVEDGNSKKTNKQILDDLNLPRFCCRTRIIGSVDLTAEFPFTF